MLQVHQVVGTLLLSLKQLTARIFGLVVQVPVCQRWLCYKAGCAVRRAAAPQSKLDKQSGIWLERKMQKDE